MRAIVIEYEDSEGGTRRIRIEPRQRGPDYWLHEEVQDGDGWHLVGREPIRNVDIDRDPDVVV